MHIKETIKKVVLASKEKEIIPIQHPVNSNHILDEKVALITGGTGGIGSAIAKSLYENGCSIIIGGTNKKKLDVIPEEVNINKWRTIEYDYFDIDSFATKIEYAASFFNGIDILICSAGVHTEDVDFWTVKKEEFSRVIDINLKGTFFSCLEFAKYLKKLNRKGHILIISSSRGSEPAWSPYGVSKWGLKGITEGFAKMLLPYGITVNSIAPGPTATELLGYNEGANIFTRENKAGRLIMPDEVATLATYLVSDASNMLTGETINISAGRGVFDIR